jgi:hypothetical protein
MLSALVVIALTVAGLDPKDVEAAMSGQLPVQADAFVGISGGTAGRGQGAVLIWRPIADVWATLTRFVDRPEYIPRLKKLKVLEQQPNRIRLWQEIDATVTTARYTAWYDLDAATHTIHWKLDPSAGDNTVKAVEGEYAMVAVDERRTLLVYRTTVDAGLHVPKGIQRYMTKRSVPDLLRNIKRRVESGGTWKQ